MRKIFLILSLFIFACDEEKEDGGNSPSIYGYWISSALEECTSINSADECIDCSDTPLQTTAPGLCENENDECLYTYMEMHISTSDSLSFFVTQEFPFDKIKCNEICTNPEVTNGCWSEEMQQCYFKSLIGTHKISISDNILCTPKLFISNDDCEIQEDQCSSLDFISNSELITHTKEYGSCKDMNNCDTGILTEEVCNALENRSSQFYWVEEYCNYINWTRQSNSGLQFNHIEY